MTATVVSRLHTAAASGRVLPNGIPTYIQITVEDARALLDIIGDLCDEHLACNVCEAVLCETCGIGERGDTDQCLEFHCSDCGPEFCPPCGRDIADDRKAEAYAEATGGRY